MDVVERFRRGSKGMAQKREKVLQLAKKLAAAAPDPHTRRLAAMLATHINFPLEAILEKVPGDGPTAKAKVLGVSRTAFYGWLQGKTRPRTNEAVKISEMTGYKVSEITGLPSGLPE
jgi:hypothetical protein